MKIKTTMRYHLTSFGMVIIKKKKKLLHTKNAVKGVEKREPSYTHGFRDPRSAF